ncbi:hypothetical protein DSM101010T_33450 [Desulfovibrio subterraneus]|uniref:Uncharacterized protein n=1 Tax=Desulfovibrio subterraneus TaxID=2718620 RepID=A0A7J0BMS1_9BACT|nr:hypothetical protein DSM101010T_33450 [Desulfovibrio subterraneus]
MDDFERHRRDPLRSNFSYLYSVKDSLEFVWAKTELCGERGFASRNGNACFAYCTQQSFQICVGYPQEWIDWEMNTVKRVNAACSGNKSRKACV